MFRTTELSPKLKDIENSYEWFGDGLYGRWSVLVVATKLSDVKRIVRKHYDSSSPKDNIVCTTFGNFGENPISEKDVIKVVRNTAPFRVTPIDKITLKAAVC
jgi:hypothetical protein